MRKLPFGACRSKHIVSTASGQWGRHAQQDPPVHLLTGIRQFSGQACGVRDSDEQHKSTGDNINDHQATKDWPKR
jgi:hypothetical protein